MTNSSNYISDTPTLKSYWMNMLFGFWSGLLLCISQPYSAQAQDNSNNFEQSVQEPQVTLRNEGLNGMADKKRRGPVLTISTHTESSQVRILADAYIDNKEYSDFPIKFDFYVNQKLFGSQLRTKELSGPIGVHIPLAEFPLPFNYQVMASTIFQNGSHSTLIQGAIFSKEYVATFSSCQLVIGSPVGNDSQEGNDSAQTFISRGQVSTGQTSDDSFSMNFDATEVVNAENIKVQAGFTVTGSDSVSAKVTVSGLDNPAYILNGKLTRNQTTLTSLSLTNLNSTVTLSCPTPATPEPLPPTEEPDPDNTEEAISNLFNLLSP